MWYKSIDHFCYQTSARGELGLCQATILLGLSTFTLGGMAPRKVIASEVSMAAVQSKSSQMFLC